MTIPPTCLYLYINMKYLGFSSDIVLLSPTNISEYSISQIITIYGAVLNKIFNNYDYMLPEQKYKSN